VNARTMSAQVLPSGPGSPEAIGEAIQGVQGYTIKVGFRRDIGIENRILWREQVLTVLAAADMTGKRAYLWIRTDAGVVTD